MLPMLNPMIRHNAMFYDLISNAWRVTLQGSQLQPIVCCASNPNFSWPGFPCWFANVEAWCPERGEGSATAGRCWNFVPFTLKMDNFIQFAWPKIHFLLLNHRGPRSVLISPTRVQTKSTLQSLVWRAIELWGGNIVGQFRSKSKWYSRWNIWRVQTSCRGWTVGLA